MAHDPERPYYYAPLPPIIWRDEAPIVGQRPEVLCAHCYVNGTCSGGCRTRPNACIHRIDPEVYQILFSPLRASTLLRASTAHERDTHAEWIEANTDVPPLY